MQAFNNKGNEPLGTTKNKNISHVFGLGYLLNDIKFGFNMVALKELLADKSSIPKDDYIKYSKELNNKRKLRHGSKKIYFSTHF